MSFTKTADLKFVVDKIESAVYNAFYRQRSTVGTSVLRKADIQNPGVKDRISYILFVLYSSRQNSNYDGKTI